MWSLALSAAVAAPVAGRVSLAAEAGAYTGQSGVAFALAGAAGAGLVTVGVSGTAVGRVPVPASDPVSDRAGIALSTVELRVGRPDAGLSGVALLDAAALDPIERDCTRRYGCRSQFFLAFGEGAPVGVSVQPAAGVRLAGGAAGGVRTAWLLALQPSYVYDELELVPRMDLTVWSDVSPWSLHVWTGRYGAAVGVGHTLGAPRRPEG